MIHRGIAVSKVALVLLFVLVLLQGSVSALNIGFLLPGLNLLPPRKFPNVVVLTFDDGPDLAYTPKIAGLLSSRNVPATFFLLGKRAEAYPEIVRALSGLGFEIGSHGYSHNDLAKMNASQIASELSRTSEVIQKITGTSPRYFRPPFGSFNSTVTSGARKLGMVTVLWTVDGRDWTHPEKDTLVHTVLSQVKAGSIILLHSTQAVTLSALPEILDGISKKRLRIVSLDDWLKLSFPGFTPPTDSKKSRPPAKQRLPKEQETAKFEDSSVPSDESVRLPLVTVGPIYSQEEQNSTVPLTTDTESPGGTSQASLFRQQSNNQVIALETEEPGIISPPKYRIISNVADFGYLVKVFPYYSLLPQAPFPVKSDEFLWQDRLPSRALDTYSAATLLNNRVYSSSYYPQARFFLLFEPAKLFSVDLARLNKIFYEGGITLSLIVSEESAEFHGDFGLPARFISKDDYDKSAIFRIGKDSLPALLDLFRRKKESIFVTLAGEDEGVTSEILENSIKEFLIFRQLTYNRIFDPARELADELSLSPGVAYGRFSLKGVPLIVIASDKPSFSIPVKRFLSRFKVIEYSESGFEVRSLSQGTLLASEGSALYLLGE